MTGKIFLKPQLEDMKVIGTRPGELLQLRKLLHRICDSGDYWANTFARFVRDDLNLPKLKGDMAVYYHSTDGFADGIVGSYVDDYLCAVGK